MKKVLSLVMALVVLLAVCICPASAGSAMSSLIPTIDPGETRRETEYSYAWLDKLIIRDDASAVVATTIVPKPDDYPYSHTFPEFVEEVKAYCELKNLDENTVASAYEELMSVIYYTVVALQMTDDYDVMAKYLRDYGINVPDSPTSEDKMNVAVVYAALKYNAVYAIYGKEVSIPKGISAEGAAVIILSTLSGIMLPSGVNSFTGLAVHSVKNYVTDFEDLPVSKNPGAGEVFYWAKLLTASSYDSDDDDVPEYDIPYHAYDVVGEEDAEYVDYAYFATILGSAYDVTLDPEELMVAHKDGDSMEIPRLILETMLKEKGISFDASRSAESLFESACLAGCFNLEEEFYSDVFEYDVTIAQSREKIWFTPFAVADQLEGGVIEAVSMSLNGMPAGHNQTTGIVLDPSKARETVSLAVNYNDGYRNESVIYTFNIIKDKSLNSAQSSSDNNLVAQVESFVGSINPSSNEKADEILGGVSDYITGIVPEYTTGSPEVLTTFGNSQGNISVPGSAAHTDGYEFNYLDDLMNSLYETDANGNIVTTKGLSFAGVEEKDDGSVIAKATTVVKENPEIVAVPTSVIALGVLAGYLMTKKHKDSALILDEEKEDSEEDAEL